MRGKIIAILRTLGISSSEDIESLCHDIFIEAFVDKKPITYIFVKHRTINRYVSSKIYRTAVEESGEKTQRDHILDVDNQDLFSRLLLLAQPTSAETTVICCIYISGMTHKEAAKTLRKSEHWVQETLRSAIEKLKTAGRWITAGKKGGV